VIKSKLVMRANITNATRLKYLGRGFSWGHVDCLHMFRHHAVAFNHACPRIPKYKNAIGALRALKREGHESLETLVDSMLPRITPAAMLVGDVALMESPEENPLDAIVISVGGNVMGWHESGEDGLVTIIPKKIKAAWSIVV